MDMVYALILMNIIDDEVISYHFEFWGVIAAQSQQYIGYNQYNCHQVIHINTIDHVTIRSGELEAVAMLEWNLNAIRISSIQIG